MSKFYDSLETRDPEAREKGLLTSLPRLIARAKELAPGWAKHLQEVDPHSITSRADLATLPVLHKSDLKTRQTELPPMGGFTTTELSAMGRLFMSPGPIFEPEGRGEDWWGSARALFSAGFRKGDIVHNAFSYHLTPGGFILDAGARAIGCVVIPAGVGNTEMQVEAITRLKPNGYTGTPDFLKILFDKAAENGQDVGSMTKALVSGAALPPSLREEIESKGVSVFQAYTTADIGVIAYETPALDGMVVEEGVLLEIVRPGTGDPVGEGEIGEVVVTNFNRDYPMIRLATGDLSATLPGLSPCGRTNMRIKGWLGRADQVTKVKGMFVHPSHVAAIANHHPELGRLRLIVTREGEQDVMTLEAESSEIADELKGRISDTLQAITKLKGRVTLQPLGSLPNDGLTIVDKRSLN